MAFYEANAYLGISITFLNGKARLNSSVELYDNYC